MDGWVYVIIVVAIAIATAVTAGGVYKAREEYRDKKAAWDALPEGERRRMLGYGGEAPSPPPGSIKGVLLIGLGFFFVATLLASVTFVGSRTIGIQTQFGVYTSTMDQGFYMKRPWSTVEKFTTRIQTVETTLNGDEDEDNDSKHAIPVAFEGGGKGWVYGISRWSIANDTSSGGAKALWDKYKDFDTVRETLVYAETRDAFINVANDFAPEDAIAAQDEMGSKVRARLEERLKPYGVTVDSVSILSLPLNEPTQKALDRIVASEANIANAENEYQRALKDAETAKVRAQSGALSDQGNTRYCLEMMNAWDVGKNGPLPAGFTCGSASDLTKTLSVNPTP